MIESVTPPGAALARLCRLCAPAGRLVEQAPREGAGGRCSRPQKRLEGLRTVLSRRGELIERAAGHGLAGSEAYRLPHNMVIAFDAMR